MKSVMTWGAVFCIGLTSSAYALPQAAAEDSKSIARCIEAAQKGGRFAGNCIGTVADPCIKAAADRDSYVEDAKACAARELAVWVVRLQNSLKIIGRNGGAKMLSSVTVAQTNWTSSRDTLCPLFNNLDPGASLGADEYCRLQETARRVLLLERLGAAVSEH